MKMYLKRENNVLVSPLDSQGPVPITSIFTTLRVLLKIKAQFIKRHPPNVDTYWQC